MAKRLSSWRPRIRLGSTRRSRHDDPTGPREPGRARPRGGDPIPAHGLSGVPRARAGAGVRGPPLGARRQRRHLPVAARGERPRDGGPGSLRRDARPEPSGLRGGRRPGRAHTAPRGGLRGHDGSERPPAPQARLLPRRGRQRLGVRAVPLPRSGRAQRLRPSGRGGMTSPRYDSLDAALELLAPYGPELANGFTSHAPMVAEALCALGRPDAVLPWLERARPGFAPRPAPRAPLEPGSWREALGRAERTADWMALGRAELAVGPWRPRLRRWLVRLTPGYCTDALHGPIRVAHAARALAAEDTAPRRRELGDALGAWAAGYQTLPTPTSRSPGSLSPEEAVGRVPIQPIAERGFRGSIVSALAGLTGFAPFTPAIDWIAPETGIGSLTRAFARVLLRHAHEPLHAIVFVHGVTSAAALRALVPHLDAGGARALVRSAWQAGAALLASFGSEPAPPSCELEPPRDGPEALVERAIAHGDDHAIKITEACLQEHALEPSPLYLAAASRALDLLTSN